MAAPTTTYRMWMRLAERPGGSRLFSAAAMARVPYFASIVPHVVRMEPGYAEVTVPKWFFVYNHLHTVHAIASCNAAEIAIQLAGGKKLAEIQGAKPWNLGPKKQNMTALFLTPVAITKDNLDVVINAGWASKDVVCQGVKAGSVKACN